MTTFSLTYRIGPDPMKVEAKHFRNMNHLVEHLVESEEFIIYSHDGVTMAHSRGNIVVIYKAMPNTLLQGVNAWLQKQEEKQNEK